MSTLVGMTWAGIPGEFMAGEPNPQHENVLSQRALAGDERAWNELTRRYHRRLVVFAMARLGVDDVEADDLAQQTWLVLTTRIRRQKLAYLDLPGLAFAQARFLHLNRLKRRGREAADEIEDDLPLPDPAQSADERIAQESLVRRIREIVEQDLSPRQRDVLVEGLSRGGTDAETATALQLSLQRVRELKSEAYRRIRKVLSGELT